MRARVVGSLGLLIAAAIIVAVPVRAAGSEPIWDYTADSSFKWVPAGTQANLQAHCESGQIAIAGFAADEGNNDVRRVFESVAGSSYEVVIDNQSQELAAVTAVVRCIPGHYVSGLEPRTDAFGVNDTSHLAEGYVACPAGYKALSGSARPVTRDGEWATTGVTVLTSAPTANQTGWEARAWSDDVAGWLRVSVTCVPAADMAGARTYTHLDQVGWGTPATADCPVGMVAITGGTVHVGGDSGAITVNSRPTFTGSGWVSTTLSFGGGLMQSTVVCMPRSEPQVTLAGTQGNTASSTGAWTFSATDPAAAGGYTMTTRCRLSHLDVPGGWEPCTSPVSRTGLAEGFHRFEVMAETSDGRRAVEELTFTVDTTPPVVTLSQPATRFRLALSTTVAWAGQDAGSGVASYELRQRRAPLNGGFGDWSAPTTFPSTVSSQGFGSLVPGSTYCYAVTAVDNAGNRSATARRCTAVPLDDRALDRSGRWTEQRVSPWYRGTALVTNAKGASLAKTGASFKRIGIVVQKCPLCGEIGLFVGTTRVARFDLASPTTRRVTLEKAFADITSGTVRVKVLSAREAVRVDALGFSRV